MKKPAKKMSAIAAIFFVFIFIAACLLLPNLRFNSDILSLFPQGGGSAERFAEQQLSGFISNRMFMLVGARSLDRARKQAQEVAGIFQKLESVSELVLERDAEKANQLLSLYREHALGLVSDEDLIAIQASPERFMQQRLRRAYQSPGQLGSSSFLEDPFDLSSGFMKQAGASAATKLDLNDGMLVVEGEGKHWVLLQLDFNQSAFSVALQDQIEQALQQAASAIETEDASAELLVSGAVQFAAAGTRQAKREISTVGTGSLLGIIVILLWVFRSPAILFSSLIPTAVGILCGVLAVLLFFSEIHVVAMVFGASLVGVSIDYTLHFLVTRMALSEKDKATLYSEAWSADIGVKRLFNGITLGLLTSSCAYLSFLFSGFPGFQQIAVFSAAGLLGAYLTVMGVFPPLMKSPFKRKERHPLFSFADFVMNIYKRIELRSPTVLFSILIFVSLCVWGLGRLDVRDDIRQMQAPDEQVLQQNERFSRLTGQGMAYQFFLVSADSPESLLSRLEVLAENLNARGIHHLSPGHWLPSRLRQMENARLLDHALNQSGLLTQYINHLRIKPEGQRRILENWQQQQAQPLAFGDALPDIQRLVSQPGYFEYEQKHYAIVMPLSVTQFGEFAEIATEMEQVVWVDKVENTSRLFEQFRHQSARLLLIAYGVIVLLLALRYGLYGALRVVFVPMVASVVSLAVLGLFGVSINVFNLMALLLVLGIGIDYSLFLRESGDKPSETWVAISLSAATTVLAFGLLSLSETYAISSFGITVLLGIVLCLLFAPLVLLSKTNDIKIN